MIFPLRNRISVVVVVVALIVSTECFPAKTKKGGVGHRRTVGRHKGHGKTSSTKKDSVNQRIMSAVMTPGKLDMSDQRELDQFQDYNKAYINNEMAAETSLLANQGIDDDSALKISNMAALPNEMDRRASSKKGISGAPVKGVPMPFNKPNVAGFSPDEYMLDANSWPEYRIKDSDYNNKNYRVFPQGGGYQGGEMGGAMQYGQKVAEGMEGPYGDGNYGFAPAGPQQMVSDEQEGGPEGPGGPGGPGGPLGPEGPGGPEGPEGPLQEESAPMTMTPDNERIQKLVMKHHRNMHNGASENYADQGPINESRHREEASGSGDVSGSGSRDHDTRPVTLLQESGNNASISKPAGEGSGQVTINTKPDGTIVTDKAPDSASQESPSSSLPGKSDQQSSTGLKVQQETTTPDQSQSSNKLPVNNKDLGSKQNSNSESGKPTTDQAKPNSQNKTSESGSESTHSTLGEFAKFLKAKGITLTINKDGTTHKEHAGNGDIKLKGVSINTQPQDSPAHQSKAHPSPSMAEAMSSMVLPSAGQPTDQAASPMNVSPNSGPEGNGGQQNQGLNNAVMHWQNIVPQESQLGELILRHKTKQSHS